MRLSPGLSVGGDRVVLPRTQVRGPAPQRVQVGDRDPRPPLEARSPNDQKGARQPRLSGWAGQGARPRIPRGPPRYVQGSEALEEHVPRGAVPSRPRRILAVRSHEPSPALEERGAPCLGGPRQPACAAAQTHGSLEIPPGFKLVLYGRGSGLTCRSTLC